MQLQSLFQEPLTFIIWALAVIFAITVHEFSHALAGHLQGDKTAEHAGRLTLNPLSHIDLLGFLMLIIVGFGWGRPVPFNPFAIKNKKLGPTLVGLAGPLANLISVIIFALILRFIILSTDLGQQNLLFQFVVSLIQVNLVLMVFNLIPIPPLDGSKILYSLLPYSQQNVIFFLERYGPYLLLALVFLGGSLLSTVFIYLYQLVIGLALL